MKKTFHQMSIESMKTVSTFNKYELNKIKIVIKIKLFSQKSFFFQIRDYSISVLLSTLYCLVFGDLIIYR